ncbi:MAG: DUF268 domain-containing protein [Candidatus Helarchaeota archaeon]|nr:DUF268 domain-containing protein [Candidatus Helarchaeota archaeon]
MGRFKKFVFRWLSQIIDPSKLKNGIPNYIKYLRDWRKYSRMKGAEPIKLIDTFPHIHDKTKTTSFDKHYFYQDIWAFKRILESKCDHHIDVGSRVIFVGFLTVITRVTFIDIRPLLTTLENFESKRGSVLEMPYKINSISSISCLHVAEHIGLGRYGDPLDPLGTKKATKELARVLALGGNLFFSLPIGKPKLYFNSHRIHSTKQIFDYFSDLSLVELSGIDDKGNFIKNIESKILDSCKYGCGLFWFTKK